MKEEAPVNSEKSTPKPKKHQDLEIKDAQIIFTNVWSDLEQEIGRENLRFPKELILLRGAPGAGKGTNAPFIMKVRGLTCEPIVISQLLDTPDAQRIKNVGGMVGDQEVISILFRELLKPAYKDGAILDGFPRTKVQVECLKLLFAKMTQLRREYYNTSLSPFFRQPIIHIMVLFVDEKESIARQLKRGEEVYEHNKEVRESGVGELLEERVTDLQKDSARHRYKIFKEQTFDALQSLREIFHYHFINAQGTIDEVQRNIIKELQYQSSIELDPRTYDCLRNLPTAEEIAVHARQELVRRLDGYEFNHAELFQKVIRFIERKIMPIVLRHAISGRAYINSEDSLMDDSLALSILIDIFSERGFHAIVDVHRQEIPESMDLETGKICCRTKRVYRIQIRFTGSEIRRGT
ncbi:MAG: nucleoside monophosphate kinase [Opitutaceae bacterium]|nr:nucleoside monophosphate kinase [Opitutaceae bacterium]